MKKSILLLLLAIFIHSYAYSQSNAELGVASIGLVVSDISESETFYKNIIGMKELWKFSLDEQWSKEAGASNNKPFSVKMFALVEAPSATTLKLAYFEEMEKRPYPTGIDVQPGINYITLNYTAEGFLNVIERIDSAGIKKTGWVKRDRYQLFFVQDPDGVFVEIVGPPEQ